MGKILKATIHPDDGMIIEGKLSQLGVRGYSAYDLAVKNGFSGTEEEWIASLKGEKGDKFKFEDFTEEELALLKGEKGDDGISPVANVERIERGARVTVTDAEGTTTSEIYDGVDGFSPTAKVESTYLGAKITITDKNGTTASEITRGKDGFSPSVKVEDTSTGVKITVQDEFDKTVAHVQNGRDGIDYEHSEEFENLAEQIHTDAERVEAGVESIKNDASIEIKDGEYEVTFVEEEDLKRLDISDTYKVTIQRIPNKDGKMYFYSHCYADPNKDDGTLEIFVKEVGVIYNVTGHYDGADLSKISAIDNHFRLENIGDEIKKAGAKPTKPNVRHLSYKLNVSSAAFFDGKNFLCRAYAILTDGENDYNIYGPGHILAYDEYDVEPLKAEVDELKAVVDLEQILEITMHGGDTVTYSTNLSADELREYLKDTEPRKKMKLISTSPNPDYNDMDWFEYVGSWWFDDKTPHWYRIFESKNVTDKEIEYEMYYFAFDEDGDMHIIDLFTTSKEVKFDDGTDIKGEVEALQTEVTQQKKDLTDIANRYQKNYSPLIDETIQNGTTIFHQEFLKGNTYIITNDNSGTSIIIPTVKDKDGNTIENLGQINPQQTNVVTPTKDGRIGFYSNGTNMHVLVENTNDIYYKFSKPKKTVFTVGIDKDYPNLVSCFKDLKNNTDEKTIYVDAGVYDMFGHLGGKAYSDTITSSSNWKDVNVFVPRNTKVIGIGNVILDFMPTTSQITQVASNLLSPINILGSVHLENIEIRCDNCRYGIHDDGSGSDDNAYSVKTYKNVRVRKSKSNASYGYPQAFGGGGFNKMTFNFDNCIFEAMDTNSVPFSIHDNNNSLSLITEGYVMNAKDCAFISKSNNSIRFGNVSWRNIPNKIYIANSYLTHKIEVNRETDSAKQIADITLVRCSDIDVTYDLKSGDNNEYIAKVYN